jgi:hypothetical protein
MSRPFSIDEWTFFDFLQYSIERVPNQSICSQEKTCSFQARKEKFLTFRSLARLALSKRTPGGAVEGVTVEPTRCMMHSADC